MSLMVRGGVVWLLLLVMAIANGAVREAWLTPRWGEASGHILSTIVLALLVVGISRVLSGWLDVADSKEAWLLGVVWVGLTLSFEFIGGRYLFGASWERLLADYNLLQGRVWILIPTTILLAPRIVYWLEGRH